MDNSQVDIRPSLGDILDSYQRLSYRPETALAEFVDNSTASYFENIALFKMLKESLSIDIVYDSQESIITIKDNAWGMSKQIFSDALKISHKPNNRNGRNEFGMGLKTAASWFGKLWKVTTKTRNSSEEYTAIVDIEKLVSNKENNITISTREVKNNSHYTIIEISKLSRRVYARTLDKLKEDLSSIYRHDINKDNITITVNGDRLSYDLPDILTETVDGLQKEWKKDFEDVVTFNGFEYPFNGFVALRRVGNYKKTGFALLRRGRVIVGGNGKNFKPQEIFGSENSFQSLRIFGEVHMDEWPVTQSKDAFDWDLDGLKEAFIEKLKTITTDYIEKAKTFRKSEAKDRNITNVEVKDIGDETYDDLKSVKDVEVNDNNDVTVSSTTVNDNQVIPSYTTTVNILNNTYHIKVDFISDYDKELITVNDNEDDDILNIIFNASHPYFEEIKDKDIFTKVFQKYLILQVLSEKYLQHISTNKGLVYPYQVRETINRMLEEIKQSKEQ